MSRSKNKKKFTEPVEGWFYHPSGNMCMSCTKLGDNCSGLKFNEMKIVLETYEGNKVVKCNEHDHGVNTFSHKKEIQLAKWNYLQMNFSVERAEELAIKAAAVWRPIESKTGK